jgi:2-haloacid dehalogenase
MSKSVNLLRSFFDRMDTVFFDAYGTLFDVSGVATACAAVCSRPDAFVAGWRRRQLEYSWLRSLMGRYVDFEQVSADALAATADAERVELDEEARRQFLAAWLRPAAFPDVPCALDDLSQHSRVGSRLGILSNGSPAMLATVLEHTDLSNRFRWVLSVDAVKVYKPSPAVYGLAVQASGSPRERILFVSSNAWDIAGAAAFGLRTCWLNRAGATSERLGAAPDHVISTLANIAELLG